MKKFNFKSRGFITALVTTLLLGLGYNIPGVAPVVTEVVCGQVACEA